MHTFVAIYSNKFSNKQYFNYRHYGILNFFFITTEKAINHIISIKVAYVARERYISISETAALQLKLWMPVI